MKKVSKRIASALLVTSILSSPVIPTHFAEAVSANDVVSNYQTVKVGDSLLIRDGLYERHNMNLTNVEVKDGKVIFDFDYSSRSIIKEGYMNAEIITKATDLKVIKTFSTNVKYKNTATISYEVDASEFVKNDGFAYITLTATNKSDDFDERNTQKLKVTLPSELTNPTTPEEPTTEAPTTEAPTTEAPTTEAPTTEAPTTEKPTTESPVSGPGVVVVNNESLSQYSFEKETTGYVQNKSIVQSDIELLQKDEPFMIDRNFELSKEEMALDPIKVPKLRTLTDLELGATKTFKTTNMSGSTPVKENTIATLEYKGSKALVWVADPKITRADAAKVGKEFDTNIAPLVNEKFGKESDLDRNGKVNILLFDIKDNFMKSSYGYIGGYFDGADLLGDYNNAKGETFYMDTYPSMGYDYSLEENTPRQVEKIYSTLAHEFQHMVNFNQKYLIQNQLMDTYLNEAFSMAAEHIYSGPIDNRIDYYNSSTYIQNGHSLTQWSRAGDTLSNYSLSYLFGQYINEQAGVGDEIYKEIIAYNGTTNDALQHIVHKYVSPTKSLGEFMTDFRVALIKHEKSGKYSLGSEPEFQNLRTLYANKIPTELRPQASVAVKVNDLSTFKIPANKGKNITYTKVK